MIAKLKSGSQFEQRACVPFNNTINQMDGVLQVEQQHTLLQHQITDVIGPDRQSIFQSKFAQVFRRSQIELAARPLLAAERNDFVVIEMQEFRDVAPHDHAAVRRWQCRNQQSVIAPGNGTGHCARSVTSKTIRD